MPRPGGEADKLGNRYESLWVVDAALDLIDGEFVEFVFEAIGDEAAGVEFYRTHESGIREYHSIKRQQGGGNWTINSLTRPEGSSGRSILRDLIQKVQQGAEAVFSSGTSAKDLDELIEGARADRSLEDFENRIRRNAKLSGLFRDKLAPICGGAEAAYAVLRRFEVRTKNDSTLRKDVERRVRSTFRMSSGEPVDARATHLLMADFAVDNLGVRLNADSFMSFLTDRGIVRSRLAGDTSVSESMNRLNSRYLAEVDRVLINGAEISRGESETAYAALLDMGKSVMLEAVAGGGKSCVLAQVVRQLDDNDVPSLVIRLDRFSEGDNSAQAVGTSRGLPDSPTITLGEFAGGRPSVLCIDQLDALSFVSARQPSAWEAFSELLDEALRYPNMRVLFACRSFDLEQDAQLRALVKDEKKVERIRVEALDPDSIEMAIEAAGIAQPELTGDQLGLLSVPLHLYLFLEAARNGEVGFASRGDLFDAFWDAKARIFNARLTGQGVNWTQAITSLCNAMSERESLVAPSYAMDEFPEAIDVMASEGVVYLQDKEIRLFHESFFDYSFARAFLRTYSNLVQWLEADDQHLFRRSQVRQVLTFLRDREPDRSRYLQTLRGLLESAEIRFHIKKLILQWMSTLPDPTDDEWGVIEELVDELGGHAWQVISNSVPWFDLLQDMGRWKSWLDADDQQIDVAVRLLQMPNVLNARSAAVTTLVRPYQGGSDQWRDRMLRLVQVGNNFVSTEMQDLVIGLIADGTLDEAGIGDTWNYDWWSLWYTASKQRPVFTVRVIGAWFDRQVVRAVQLGLDDPFSGDQERVAYSAISKEIISNCVSGAPLELVRTLLPRFVTLEEIVPKGPIVPLGSLGKPEDQLRDALIEAMMSIARDNPAELDSILEADSLDDTKWNSALILRVWGANPDVYAERIVRYILDCPEQRLVIGYSLSIAGSDPCAAVSRTAIAGASPSCSDSTFSDLENSILELAPSWERKVRRVGWTEFMLLRSLDQKRLAETTRQRIRELERRFPNVPVPSAPKPYERERVFQRVDPPISDEAQQRMSDEQWLSAMTEYRTRGPIVRGDKILRGSEQLAQGLTMLTNNDPERFASLVNQMDTTYPSVYFEAILTGLTANARGSDRAGTPEQVCTVLRRIRDASVPVSGKAFSEAVGAIADGFLPSDIVEVVCRIALEDPDPESDLWRSPSSSMSPIDQAINSARGAAAAALARLLTADSNRWDDLKPTIELIVDDRVLAVRSAAVDALLAILDSQRGDALACFEKLAEGADPILGTGEVERFLNYAIFRDYPVIRPILLRMLDSPEPGSVRTGASMIVLASLFMDEAQGDEDIVLNGGEEARVGAARVYSDLLADETVGTECEARLGTLFVDESEDVRREAGGCWLRLNPDQIAARGSLIGAFAEAMKSDTDANIIAYQLREARRPLPAEVCDLAQRTVAAFGYRASSEQNSEAGAASDLAVLMVRLHEETKNPILRRRILDVIDEMIRAGFIGIDEQLERQYDR